MAKKVKAKTKTRSRSPKAPKSLKGKTTKKVSDGLRKAAAAITGAASKAVKNFAASLGSMKIDKALAADQMEELGTLLEDVAAAKVTADTKAEDAKTAKGTYESKVNLLLEKLRGFTHPKALPLFDAVQREADLVDMTTKDRPVGADTELAF